MTHEEMKRIIEATLLRLDPPELEEENPGRIEYLAEEIAKALG